MKSPEGNSPRVTQKITEVINGLNYPGIFPLHCRKLICSFYIILNKL